MPEHLRPEEDFTGSTPPVPSVALKSSTEEELDFDYQKSDEALKACHDAINADRDEDEEDSEEEVEKILLLAIHACIEDLQTACDKIRNRIVLSQRSVTQLKLPFSDAVRTLHQLLGRSMITYGEGCDHSDGPTLESIDTKHSKIPTSNRLPEGSDHFIATSDVVTATINRLMEFVEDAFSELVTCNIDCVKGRLLELSSPASSGIIVKKSGKIVKKSRLSL